MFFNDRCDIFKIIDQQKESVELRFEPVIFELGIWRVAVWWFESQCSKFFLLKFFFIFCYSFVDIYSKVEKLSNVFSFFLTNEWNFDDKNLVSLSNRMSERDRQLYNFDVASIDWDFYSVLWVLSLRKYVIKDGFQSSEYARKKQKILKVANYVVLFVYLYLCWIILSYVFKLFY